MKAILVIGTAVLSLNFFLMALVLLRRHDLPVDQLVGILATGCCIVWASVGVTLALRYDVVPTKQVV